LSLVVHPKPLRNDRNEGGIVGSWCSDSEIITTNTLTHICIRLNFISGQCLILLFERWHVRKANVKEKTSMHCKITLTLDVIDNTYGAFITQYWF